MSTGGRPTDEMSDAERRVVEYVETLGEDVPQPGHALAPRIVRTARWQRGLRAPLRAVGVLAAAVADALARLLRRPSAGRARARR